MALRCLIVDDDADFLRTARASLDQGGLSIVGVASSATEALAMAAELCPDPRTNSLT